MVVALEGVRAGPDIPYPAVVCAVGDWEAVGVVSVEVEEERLEVVACVVGEGELEMQDAGVMEDVVDIVEVRGLRCVGGCWDGERGDGGCASDCFDIRRYERLSRRDVESHELADWQPAC